MLSEKQLIIMATLPRLFIAVSVCSCGYIMYSVLSNPQYRSRMYHRLMLGMASTMMIHLTIKLWGTAAVPHDTRADLVYGARGSTTTCTVQGFVNQMGYVPLFYYVALSFYSYVAVRNHFNLSKLAWVEKWCHLGAFAFPLASSIYLASIQSFNFNGYTCWVNSIPNGCGTSKGIECTRGPQNIGQIMWWFNALPIMVILILPTIVMLTLYVHVRNTPTEPQEQQQQPQQQPVSDETNGASSSIGGGGVTTTTTATLVDANTVALQAGTYLVALYWSFFFSFLDYALYRGHETELFPLRMIAICQRQLVGFYILLAYLRLRVSRRPNSNEETTNSSSSSSSPRKTTTDPHCSPGSGGCVVVGTATSSSTASQTLGFSIFDGSIDDSSPWKDFIFDGEEEDEQLDDFESQRWDNVIQR